jgi:hypothetical protein
VVYQLINFLCIFFTKQWIQSRVDIGFHYGVDNSLDSFLWYGFVLLGTHSRCHSHCTTHKFNFRLSYLTTIASRPNTYGGGMLCAAVFQFFTIRLIKKPLAPGNNCYLCQLFAEQIAKSRHECRESHDIPHPLFAVHTPFLCANVRFSKLYLVRLGVEYSAVLTCVM